MKIFLLLCLFFAVAEASEESRREYLELVKRYPLLIHSQGDYTQGEIQIIIDPQEMAAIEAATGRDVGVMKRDKYWLWVNDACAFPNGKKGVYGRFMWMRSLEGAPGVAVMPILSDGKIVLNCNFRHATRSWEIELPRGVVDHGEDVEAAARRETLEETGMVVESLMLLGEITPDTGVANTIVPVFAANVGEKMVPQQQESEAIEEVLALSMQEIKHAFLQGYYECNVRGIQKKIPFRDPFLAYAIFMHDIKKEK